MKPIPRRNCEITVAGTVWAEIQYSEPRQQWCVLASRVFWADQNGQQHAPSIVATAATRNAAIALAEQMIRSGTMPDPRSRSRKL
jgi:hypothetical protein